MNNQTAYLLGQIYGKFVEVNHKWNTPAMLSLAMHHPMNAISQLHIRAIQSNLFSDELNEYIRLRLNDVSVDDVSDALDVDTTGAFVLGQHSCNLSAADIIKSIDITQEEIAERLGVAPNTVSRWRSGTTTPSQETLYKLQCIRFNPFAFERLDGMVLVDDVIYDPRWQRNLIVEDRGNYYFYDKPHVKNPTESQFRRIKVKISEQAQHDLYHRFELWGMGICKRKDVNLYETEKESSSSSGSTE